MTADRIEKTVLLPVPIERAWQAIGDSAAFGHWFGAAFDGPFVEGARVAGRIVPTRVDPEIAKMQQPYAGTPFEIVVDRVEPPRRLAFRWPPYGADEAFDPATDPLTRVELRLEEHGGGTRLTIVESGFMQVPAPRRAKAYEANAGGWEMQAGLVARYLAL